ncbi:MAG: heparan-alpha-glucosaminide N-acetyltransferase domain-containing protein [Promethearchaeota archaeon]
MTERIKSLDFLRGLTIIFMILFHILIFWINNKIGLFENIIIYLGLIGAPFYLLISGISLNCFINSKIEDEIPKIEVYLDVLKRAVFIFLISTFLKFLFGHFLNLKFSFLYWSIFQVIAVAMILFSFILFLGKWKLISYLFLIIFIFIINHLIIINDLIIFSFLIYGSFPFIPWVNFLILGLIIGAMLDNFKKEQYQRMLYIFFGIGIITISLWSLLLSKIYYLKINLFFHSFAVFLILFSLCYFVFDIRKISFKLDKILIRWGKLSFSIYYIHFAMIAAGVILFPLIIENYYSLNLSFYYYLIIFLIFLLSIEIFLIIWEKFNYFMGLEWLMNKLSKKSLFS